MFNIIKLYNFYLTKTKYHKNRYTPSRLKKNLFHFKWLKLIFKAKNYKQQKLLSSLQLLMRFLLLKIRQKKFKKYNFFKYSIYRYRRLLKIATWCKLNQFLSKSYNLPFIKNTISYKNKNKLYNNNLQSNQLTTIKHRNLYNFYIKRNISIHWNANKLNNVSDLIQNVQTCYRTDFLDDYNYNLNRDIERQFKKISSFLYKIKRKQRKITINRKTKLIKVKSWLPIKLNSLTKFNYTNKPFICQTKSIILRTIFNTYNKKTINWRVIN